MGWVLRYSTCAFRFCFFFVRKVVERGKRAGYSGCREDANCLLQSIILSLISDELTREELM